MPRLISTGKVEPFLRLCTPSTVTERPFSALTQDIYYCLWRLADLDIRHIQFQKLIPGITKILKCTLVGINNFAIIEIVNKKGIGCLFKKPAETFRTLL